MCGESKMSLLIALQETKESNVHDKMQCCDFNMCYVTDSFTVNAICTKYKTVDMLKGEKEILR